STRVASRARELERRFLSPTGLRFVSERPSRFRSRTFAKPARSAVFSAAFGQPHGYRYRHDGCGRIEVARSVDFGFDHYRQRAQVSQRLAPVAKPEYCRVQRDYGKWLSGSWMPAHAQIARTRVGCSR